MAVKYQSRSSKLTLAITSQPTTTEYIAGDTLSLTGLVVTATRRDGSTEDVTSQCTFSPANGSSLSSSGSYPLTISYHGKTITTGFTVYNLGRIVVTTAPTKTSYNVGDTISYSGIVVTAYASSNQISRNVTSECTYNPAQGTTLSSVGSFSATITWRTKSTTQSYSVTALIYGAEWAGGSSSAWTRTDNASSFSAPSPAINNGNGSSPFDNIMPWSGMERVVEGGQSQVLVKIPKFYYKWTKTGSKMKLQISMTKVSGFYTSPAHADRGDGKGERDYVYVGAYHCADVPSSSLYHYRSLSGRTPVINITRATARSNIHSYVGNSYWQWDFAMYWTICMLYLVEYADWNSQAKIGTGVLTSLTTSGTTDSMKYHTGTTASSRSSSGRIRYRYIEDLWGNCFDWIDGLYIKNSNYYGIKNPSNFSDTSNGTYIAGMPVVDGCISSFMKPGTTGFEYALFPYSVVTDTSYSTYICDRVNAVSTAETISVGSSYFTQGTNDAVGLFRFSIARTSEETISAGGCRLMKLP